MEEEYGSTLRNQFVREPYLAHFICKNITSPYYAWIDIIAENQYGSEIYTIELPPFNNQRSISENRPKSINNTLNKDEFSKIRIYSTNGNYIKTISQLGETKSLPSGIYILEYYKGDTIVRTSKLIK